MAAGAVVGDLPQRLHRFIAFLLSVFGSKLGFRLPIHKPRDSGLRPLCPTAFFIEGGGETPDSFGQPVVPVGEGLAR